MKNLYLLTVCFLLSFSNVQAQYEVGASIGGALYFGELAPNLGENIKNVHLSFGVFGRYHLNEQIGLRLHWQRNLLAAGDGTFQDNPGLVNRNLDFYNVVDEFALLPEYSFYQKRFGFDSKVSIYGTVGVAVFLHKPEAIYNGGLQELQPLGTEGQGLPGNEDFYSLTQVSIPFGLGVKLALNKRVSIGLDILDRLTFTDYLDDVGGNYPDFDALKAARGQVAVDLSNRTLDGSTPTGRRGNPDTNDWYASATFTVAYTFGNDVKKVNKRKSSSRKKKSKKRKSKKKKK